MWWCCTYVEKVVTGHSRLTGDTGGDDDNVGVLERLSKATIGRKVASHDGGGVDVRKIGSNTDSVDDIVKSEVGDERRLLEEKRERLADTTSGADNSSLDHFDLSERYVRIRWEEG